MTVLDEFHKVQQLLAVQDLHSEVFNNEKIRTRAIFSTPRSVETMLTDLRHAGVPNVALLTDRGYESIQNLEQYILSGQKMVMCLKVGQL